MAGCKVEPEASPQFKKLREQWKKSGYLSIDADLEELFSKIRQDISTAHCNVVPRFADVLKGYKLLKYRQKDTASREGAKGAWRVYALYDPTTKTLYPIIVFPKKVMADADDDTINAAVTELLQGTLL